MPTTATHPSLWVELLGAETRFYDANGIRTRAIEAGTGDAVIMLHGIGGHAEAYARNIVPLGKELRAVSIDYLGHGLTGSIDGTLTKEAYAKHLIEFMDAAGIEKASLIGESLGGWIAFWTAVLYPDRIKKIVYCVGARLELPVPEEVKKRTAAGRDELMRLTKQFNANPSRENVRARLNWLFHKPERDVTEELIDLRWWLYQNEPSGRRGRQGNSSGSESDGFTAENLRKIAHPVLLLWTTHNPSGQVESAREALKYLPNAELQVIDDAAHWPQWEHPELFNPMVLEYLKRP